MSCDAGSADDISIHNFCTLARQPGWFYTFLGRRYLVYCTVLRGLRSNEANRKEEGHSLPLCASCMVLHKRLVKMDQSSKYLISWAWWLGCHQILPTTQVHKFCPYYRV